MSTRHVGCDNLLCFTATTSPTLTQDFEGQKLTNLAKTRLLVLGAILSTVTGFALGDVMIIWFMFAFVAGITMLLVVPPWPFFTQNPVQWQTPAY